MSPPGCEGVAWDLLESEVSVLMMKSFDFSSFDVSGFDSFFECLLMVANAANS